MILHLSDVETLIPFNGKNLFRNLIEPPCKYLVKEGFIFLLTMLFE